MSLPTEDKDRKALPIWDGVIMYWPDVWAEIAKVSVKGNDQHNPGQPLHWAREKSKDQMNTAFRHMLDRGAGKHFDTDGARHLAKAIWRLCAQLQLDLEADAKITIQQQQPNIYPQQGAGVALGGGMFGFGGQPFAGAQPGGAQGAGIVVYGGVGGEVPNRKDK